MNHLSLKPESWLVSAGRPSMPGDPLNVPPVPASNFLLGAGRSYARDDGTPTWEALETIRGGLENGRAVTFASFIGGHSDLMAGVAVTRDESLRESLRRSRELTGATPGALDAFLAVRGARTLALRLQRSQQTAMILAERLVHHPWVSRVRYPGLASHPTHEVARRLLKGFGAVLSFELRGGAEMADAVCRSVRLIRHATSLGGVESTMERRAAIPGQEHLPPSLLRLSVGIEDPDDLWDDLDLAIRAAVS